MMPSSQIQNDSSNTGRIHRNPLEGCITPSPSENNLVKLTDPLLKGVSANIYGRNILPSPSGMLPWCEAPVEMKYSGVHAFIRVNETGNVDAPPPHFS